MHDDLINLVCAVRKSRENLGTVVLEDVVVLAGNRESLDALACLCGLHAMQCSRML